MGAQAGNTDEMEQAEGVFSVVTDPKFTSVRWKIQRSPDMI